MKARFFSILFSFINGLLKIKNYRKKKLLIYTDSRGYNVISKIGKTPFDSYITKLCFNYRVDYFICPEKFTTIVDFLIEIKKHKPIDYDSIIMHCGIVDFSPRPLSNIEKVIDSKKEINEFKALFETDQAHRKNTSDIEYYGEKTNTIYSLEYLESTLAPQLKAINNLIWIDSNHFVPGWEGNFAKGRPKNINETVTTFDSVLTPYISRSISLKSWTEEEIKRYTIDNIHFNKEGFREIFHELKKQID